MLSVSWGLCSFHHRGTQRQRQKIKALTTITQSTDEARQQTEDKTDAENISGIGFSLLVSLEVHQRLPLRQITLIFVSFTVQYFTAAAGCGVYETNRPIIIEICVCTLRKCLTGEPFITLYHVVIIVMYLAAASCLSSELVCESRNAVFCDHVYVFLLKLI